MGQGGIIVPETINQFLAVQMKVTLTSNLYVLLYRDGLYTDLESNPWCRSYRPEPVLARLALRKDKFH